MTQPPVEALPEAAALARILRDADRWRLTRGRAGRLAEILDVVEQAAATSDAAVLRRARGDLAELTRRLTSLTEEPIGDAPVEPALLERINHLVHVLVEPRPGQPARDDHDE